MPNRSFPMGAPDMRYSKILALLCALLTSSCAGSLQTSPNIYRTDRLSGALQGATYSLPRLQYEVTVDRYLASCPDERDSDGNPTRLAFATEVNAETSYQPGESYVVDFSHLAGIARTASFGIEKYSDGTLKSIGVQGEDQTGQIIQDLTKAALSAWSAGTTGAGASLINYSNATSMISIDGTDAPASPSVTHIACSATALATVHALNAELAALEKLKTEADEIRRLTTAATTRASLKLLTVKDRERLSTQFEKLDQLEGDVGAITASLDKLKKVLGTQTKTIWKGDYSKSSREQKLDLNVDRDEFIRLATLLKSSSEYVPAAISKDDMKALAQAPACSGRNASVAECLKAQLELKTNFATNEPIDNYCKDGELNNCLRTSAAGAPGYQDAADSVPDRGLFVRDPLVGKLLICRAFENVCNLDTDLAGLEPKYIPQLGQLRFIPFVIRPFEGRTLNIDVAEDGRVTKMVYSTDKAMLAQIAATVAGVAGQFDASAEKMEARRRVDEDYRHSQSVLKEQDSIDHLTRQIALKDAQKALNDPQSAVKAEVAVLEAQRSLAEARRARIEAEQKLEEMLKNQP